MDVKEQDDAAKAEAVKAAQAKADQERLDKAKAKVDQATQAADDHDAEAARAHNVTVNKADAPAAVAEQHRKVDEFNAKRDEENRPGHERNLEKIENQAQEAQLRTKHADDHRANHVPTGKQQNRNTPRVLPDGTKVWDQ